MRRWHTGMIRIIWFLELWFANAALKDLKRDGWYLEQRDLCFSPVNEVDPDTLS